MSATLEKPKPGLAAALLIPFAIWLVSGVVAIVFLVGGITRAEDISDDFARVPSGQSTTVDLTDAGGYRIWIDCPGSSGDYSSPSATATITGPDGETITASTYSGSLTYNDLEAVLTFNAPSAGQYTFQITEDSFSSCGGREFAIGKDNPFAAVGTGILLMIVIGSVGFLIALILMIIMLVKRGRSKKRITQAAIQSGAYGGYGGGYGPPGGGYPPGGYPPPGGSSW